MLRAVRSTYNSPRGRQWRRVAVRLRELCPVTLRGALVLGAALSALYIYGIDQLDGVWYVAGLGLVALCALSLLDLFVATLRMKLWLRKDNGGEESLRRVDTQSEFATSFRIPRLRYLLFIDVRVRWREPACESVRLVGDTGLAEERAVLADHGEIRSIERCIELRDVFGLSGLTLRKRLPAVIDVLPHRGALLSLTPLSSLAGGDDMPHPMGVAQGDRLELKRYAPGDPARFIHWKAYARTQKLMVRMPERALSRAYRVAAFLAAGPGDGASAAVARVSLEQGALGADFRFGADGSPAPRDSVEESLIALRRSSLHRDDGARDLSAFVHEVEREGPSAWVFFVPPHAPGVETRVAALLRERARPVRIVIGVDGITPAAPPRLAERLALRALTERHTRLGTLQDTIRFYRKLGCEVLVVDRESGRFLGDAHLAHAARLKPARGVAA